MCQRKGVLYYCMLLCIVSSSNFDENLESDDEQSGKLHHDLRTKFEKDQIDKDELMQYNKGYDKILRRESRVNTTKDTRNNDDSMRYGFHTYDLMNDDENDRSESDYIKTSSTKVNDEKKSASQLINRNFTEVGGKTNSVMDDINLLNETCKDDKCIQLCCPRNDRLIRGKCIPRTGDIPAFPIVYGLNDSSRDTNLDEILQLIVKHPCPNAAIVTLDRNEYAIYANGSIYLSPYDVFVPPTFYCLAIVNRDAYEVNFCKMDYPIFISIGVLVSLPFLLVTFIVYSILPELQNIHGYTLRAHVISLFVSYIILPIYQQYTAIELGYPLCTTLAYILTFAFPASFLWLNVICFDIWWTLRYIRPIQGNVMQKERKKFTFYSIYAWGLPLLLVIICAIMDYAPNIPDYLIRPRICAARNWFGSVKALSVYFYFPIGVTVTCNICLFVITAFTIARQRERTANDINNTVRKRHSEHKQRFMMYLKLFIVMGITWIMEIASFFIDQATPSVVWYPTDMINALQGLIIFIIFVCRKRIKRLLYKKFGWQCCAERRKSSMNYDSRVSSTSSISSETNLKLQDINARVKTQ